MGQTQINRYHIIMSSLEGKVTVGQAAEAMGISERQVTRLRKGVKEKGAAFLIHGNTNRSPAHAVTGEEKDRIVELYEKEQYNGSNFQHFAELLAEHEEIHRSYFAVRKVLTVAGIESPKKRRKFKAHRRRKRKAQEGLLNQMDATPYAWFGGEERYALHGGIDDASGKVTGLYMTENECLHGYFETMRQTIKNNGGVPVSAYADRHTIFRSPKAAKLAVGEQLEGKQVNDTQFGRAMKELGITLIAARSPQAKGRIERLWETLQSRLVIEFRIAGITDVHAANVFLKEYLPKFNHHFAVKPESVESAYIPTALKLDLILCVKETRTVDNGGVFSFHGKHWKITNDSIPNKSKIEVIASATKGIVALYKGKALEVFPFVKPEKQSASKAERRKTIPSEDHCWRQGKPLTPLYSSDLVDSQIHQMLNDIFLSKYA